MKDDFDKLYSALTERGYSAEELGGSVDDFRSKMGSKETRKVFYDWVAGNGDDLGDYETYERRLGGGAPASSGLVAEANPPALAPGEGYEGAGLAGAIAGQRSEVKEQSGAGGENTANGANGANMAQMPAGADEGFVFDEAGLEKAIAGQRSKVKEQSGAGTPIDPGKAQAGFDALRAGIGLTGAQVAEAQGRIGRMAQMNTPEGREQAHNARWQARMAGTGESVMGLSRIGNGELGMENEAGAAEGEKGDKTNRPNETNETPISGPVRETRSAQPYGVVWEDGERKTQWLLPDGRLTTDLTEVNAQEATARENRLNKRFEDRMKARGLNPEVAEERVRSEMMDKQDAVQAAIKREQERIAEGREERKGLVKEGALYAMMNPAIGGGQTANELLNFSPDLHMLLQAEKTLNETDDFVKEAEKARKENNWEGAFFGTLRGLRDGAFDISTWDMGTTDLIEADRLGKALDKADRGAELSEAEQMLLDAKATEGIVKQYYSKYIGHGYKMGQTSAVSIPFMLEMAVNPASGIGKGASKAMTRYALRRFGSRLAARTLGMAARVGGDLAGSAIMTGTTGLIGTAADAQGRMNGKINGDINADGTISYAGHEGEQDYGTALAKAAAARTIENYSEQFGEYLGPIFKGLGKGASKAAESVLARRVANSALGREFGRMSSRIGNSAVAQGVRNMGSFFYNAMNHEGVQGLQKYLKKAKWHGTLDEFIEEIAGGAMNALTVGDQTLDRDEETGLFNTDNLIDTFLGVSLFGGAVSVYSTVDYVRGRQDLARSRDTARDVLGMMLWDNPQYKELASAIEGHDLETIKPLVAQAMASEGLTQEQKRQMLVYLKAEMELAGAERAAGIENGELRIENEAGAANGPDGPDGANTADMTNEAQMPGGIENGERGMENAQESAFEAEAAGLRERALPYADESGTVETVEFEDATYIVTDETGVVITLVDARTGEARQLPTKLVENRQRVDVEALAEGALGGQRAEVKGQSEAGAVNGVNGANMANMANTPDRTQMAAGATREELAAVLERGGIDPNTAFEVAWVDGNPMPITGETGNTLFVVDPVSGVVSEIGIDQVDSRMPFSLDTLAEVVGTEAPAPVGAEGATAPDAANEANEAQMPAGNEIEGTAGTTLPDETQMPALGTLDPRTMADEEKGKRGDMLRSANAIEVKEGQIVASAGVSARKAAENWWDANVPEAALYNTEVGEVEINRNSVESSLAHRYSQKKLDAITSLVEGFENAVYLGTMPDFTRQDGVANHFFAYPITYNGERHYVFCRAMQDANKNRLYVHEVFVADNIKKGNTLQTAASQPHGGIALYRDILANVLDGSAGSEVTETSAPEQAAAGKVDKEGNIIVVPGETTGEQALANVNGLLGGDAETVGMVLAVKADAARKALDALDAPASKKNKGGKPVFEGNVAKFAKEKAEWEAARAQAEAEAKVWAEAKLLHDQQQGRGVFERSKGKEQSSKMAGASEVGVVGAAVREKWMDTPKVVGQTDVYVMPDGRQLKGRYVLTESGAATASHDVRNGMRPSEGFPVDENGLSVNSRDYEGSRENQEQVRRIAANYGPQAVQNAVVVSRDGVVLSGNNRTMSGELAAQNGTDGAYVEYLREYAGKYGFTAEQVEGFAHPRVLFVADEAMPYTAETFNAFNAQETKTENRAEAAVKLGKVVDDATLHRILDLTRGFERMSDFYADQRKAREALAELQRAGVVNDKELPELLIGDALSEQGKELLENVLIGKSFEGSPEAVRRIVGNPQLRAVVVLSLNDIAHNRALGEYSLGTELVDAVNLVLDAHESSAEVYGWGKRVSPFAQQLDMFDESRVEDRATLMLADVLNSGKATEVRRVMGQYNERAAAAARGQADMFVGGVESKESVLGAIVGQRAEVKGQSEGGASLQMQVEGDTADKPNTTDTTQETHNAADAAKTQEANTANTADKAEEKRLAELREAGEAYKAAFEELGRVEEEWEARIGDYVAEHYPTQATITAESTSEKGLAEREAMEADETLQAMRAEAKRAFEEADKKATEAGQRERALAKSEDELTQFSAGGAGVVQFMGSRVDRRMASIADALGGMELTEQQRAVADVFGGLADNQSVSVEREDGKHTFVMRQGSEGSAGTKHSVFRHFNTRSGYVTAEDILKVPEILARGEKTPTGQKNKYTLEIDGTKYSVTTEMNGRQEVFTNFFSNRKAPESENLLNTPNSARASQMGADLDAKVGENSESSKPRTEKVATEATAEQRMLGEAAVELLEGAGVEVVMDEQQMADVPGAIVGQRAEVKGQSEGGAALQFLRTAKGEVFGFVKEGKVYLDPKLLNPNTPIHEYTHLWDTALRKNNPELWKRGVELMKRTKLWEQVKNDPAYADIADNEDLLASEVHSRLTGAEGEKLLNEMLEDAKAEADLGAAIDKHSVLGQLRRWLSEVWRWVKDTMTPWSKEEAAKVSLREFVEMPLADLVRGKKIAESGEPRVESEEKVESRGSRVESEANKTDRPQEADRTHNGDMNEVNARFNEQLAEFTLETADNFVFSLGVPSPVLQAAGITGNPLKLYGSKLAKKMRKHGFSAEELAGLPRAVANPIAVFNNQEKEGNRSVLTELRTADGNFLVSIDLGKGEDVDFNLVSSVFGKGDNKVVNWINKGYGVYFDKQKALDYLHLSAPIAEASDKQELSSATKIVENFENPAIQGEENAAEGDKPNTANESHIPEGFALAERDVVSAEQRKREERQTAALGRYLGKGARVADLRSGAELEEGAEYDGVVATALRAVAGQRPESKGQSAESDLKRAAKALKPGGRIVLRGAAGGMSLAEHRAWAAMELGEGWIVQTATAENAGFRSGDALVLRRADKKSVEDMVVQFSIGRQIDGTDDARLAETVERVEGIGARSAYDQMLKSRRHLYSEALTDYSRSIWVLEDAIMRSRGKRAQTDIAEAANVYDAENALGSATDEQQADFKNRYYKPLMGYAGKLSRQMGNKLEDVERYVYAKSGLERNVALARRDALRACEGRLFREDIVRLGEEYRKAKEIRATYNGGNLSAADQQERDNIDRYLKDLRDYIGSEQHKAAVVKEHYDEQLAEMRKRDYSGLTALTDKQDIADIEHEARVIVDNFEARAGDASAAELWQHINAATDATLENNLRLGLIDQRGYDAVKALGMRYYVPLKGFAEDDAGDMYDYTANVGQPMTAGTVMKADGRTSMADSPFALIGADGERAIASGLRNGLKQRLLELARTEESDLLSVDDMYLRYDESADAWNVVMPEMQPGMSADEVREAMEKWRKEMQKLSLQDPAHYRRDDGRGTLVPYRIDPRQLSEHHVVVQENGRKVLVTVNGNPRAAQVINGRFRPASIRMGDKTMETWNGLNRFQSQMYTSMSLPFVFKNFMRDYMTAVVNSSVYHGDGTAQAWRELKELGALWGLYDRWEKGTLGDSGTDARFREFMENGGETGYTQSLGIEGFRKKAQQLYDEQRKHGAKYAWRHSVGAVIDMVEYMNRVIENTTRFARYEASRTAGKGITESIADAKNVSVNFNRKGAGAATIGQHTPWDVNLVASAYTYLSQSALFVNPAMQGLKYFLVEPFIGKHATGKTRAKAGLALSSAVALPIAYTLAYAMLTGGSGDDWEDYWALPDYERNSNIIIPLGRKGEKSEYVKIPISQELAAFWGQGMTMAHMMFAPQARSGSEYALEMAQHFADLLPGSPLQGFQEDGKELSSQTAGEMLAVTGMNWLVPNAGKPLAEWALNTTWKGTPMYNESAFDKGQHSHEKGLRSTSPFLIAATKWIYDHTNSGIGSKDGLDLNPAAIEYGARQLLSSYFTVPQQIRGMVGHLRGEEEYQEMDRSKRIPVFGTFFASVSPTSREMQQLRDFYANASYAERVEHDLKGAPEEQKAAFEGSEMAQWYAWWKSREQLYSSLNKAYREAQGAGSPAAEGLGKAAAEIKAQMAEQPCPYREAFDALAVKGARGAAEPLWKRSEEENAREIEAIMERAGIE